MTTWLLVSVVLIFFSIIRTSGAVAYFIQSTKAVYESLTDRLVVNASVSKVTGLTVYLNVLDEFSELFTEVNLVVDANDRNEFDFDVVRRTINTCRLFREPTYEPVIQFLYKRFLDSGHFPTECPIRKDLYYIKDMKTDPKNLPEMMAGKKAILSVKHLSKENQKMKLLAYYEVHFGVVRVYRTNGTDGSTNLEGKSRRHNRHRSLQ